MTSQPGKQTVLCNILRSKGNQTMKFGQIIEYTIKKKFLKNHTANEVRKVFPDIFLKNKN